MQRPSIMYDSLEQPLHPNAQYLLMHAGINNGTYTAEQFLAAINAVPLDSITSPEGRRDVHNQRLFLNTFGKMRTTITIANFHPDQKRLDAFVNTTFEEMRAHLQTSP